MNFRKPLIATLIFSLFTVTLQTIAASPKHGPASRSAKQKRPANKPARRPARVERVRVARKSDSPRSNRRNEHRRLEAQRRAALARQRAEEDALRDRVQALILKDDLSGEDPEIRRVAVNALGNHAGTVVVMNPRTGQIYSIVNQQWALREGFKPCSTIKLVTGLAGLNEGVIDREDTRAISDSNQVSLTSALAHSKNEYFQTVGGRVGFSKMINYARQLGLGEKTGINVRNETPGSVPQSKSGFAVNHMSSHGDDFKVTALQLATLVSAMSNGGRLLKPFVPQSAAQQFSGTPRIRRTVDISSDAFQSMLPGMIGAVSYGSGRRAFDPNETIAGKTGTCIEHGSWIGLFTSYAPANDPELAVVVIAKGSDGRKHFPAAVAGQIYRDLYPRFASAKRKDVAPARPELTNRMDVATTDDEDDEEADEAAETSSAQRPRKALPSDRARSINDKVKPTIMAIPNRTPASATISPTGKPRS